MKQAITYEGIGSWLEITVYRLSSVAASTPQNLLQLRSHASARGRG